MSYLKDIAVFLRVVELKGFAAAGRALGVSAPSVSKQIARLEAELGVALLHRTTHNLFLTDAGKGFYERCVRALSEIEEARATAQSFNDDLVGKLRVHTTLSVGQVLIASALVDFMAANPQIRIELEMGSFPINPMEHQIDVAIRTRRARESSPGHVSIGRRVLGRVRQVIVASPEYLKRSGRPRTVEEIAQRDCLAYVTHSTFTDDWQFHVGRQDVAVSFEPVLRSNNWLAVREAAVRGLGLARLPDFAVREAIEAGRLVTLFDNEIRSDLQVQALFPRSQRMPAKTRLLLNFLAQRLAAGGQASGAGEAEGEAGDGRTADAVAVAPAHEPARTERASRAQRRT